MNWLTSPETWIALLTLTVLEIVLGIDNIIFISILSGKLPAGEQPRARTVGLTLAMVTRILLLLSLTGIMRLTHRHHAAHAAAVQPVRPPLLGPRLDPPLGRPVPAVEEHARDSRQARGRRRTPEREGRCHIRRRHRPDRLARHRVLARLGDYRRGHGPAGRRDDRRHRARGARHARGRRPDQRLRAPSPDLEDARAVVPLAHRRHAHRRRPRPTHPEGLRVLLDGLLGVRRVAQPAPRAQGGAGAPEGVDHPVTPFGVRSCSTVLRDAFFLSVVPPDIEPDHLLPVGPVVRPPVPDPQRVPDSLTPESS